MRSRSFTRESFAVVALLAVGIGIGCGDSSVASVPRVDPAPTHGGDEPPDAEPALATFARETTWFLEVDAHMTYADDEWSRHEGERLTLALGRRDDGVLVGTMTTPDGAADLVDAVATDGPWLELRRHTGDRWDWFRLHVRDGIAVGRYARATTAERPPITSYDHLVTGFRDAEFALGAAGPLGWDLLVANSLRARVRIDRGATGGFVGRFKIYGDLMQVPPSEGEELEFDLEDVAFDGTRLAFTRRDPAGALRETFTATAAGRTLDGTLTRDGQAPVRVHGTRSNLLAYGLVPRADRTSWQETTRRRLEDLLMAGNPAPSGPCAVTLGAASAPPSSAALYPNRDDDAATWPQSYTLAELTISCRLVSRFDGLPVPRPRVIHGWVAKPIAAAPPAGYRTVIAVNGHNGNAHDVMTPDHEFWYGDAFARRGYLVVAMDVKHHPDEPVDGEDGVISPILGDGFATSDWEEDGERVWDVMRATDYALSRSDVDAPHLAITGLSMGGEVTTLAAALDPRFATVVPAGWSPDTDVLEMKGSHGCWKWHNAEIRDYVDQSGLHALIAPRPLVVLTGKDDPIFSDRDPHWSHELQLMRRSRVAYVGAEAARIHHYLHFDVHAYHVGDRREGEAGGLGVQVTALPVTPESSQLWQNDGETTSIAPTLFDLLTKLSP